MLLQSPVRLPSQPLASAEPVRLRPDSSDQKQEDIVRVAGGTRRAPISDEAAVVHFGSRALGLARSQPPPADASVSDVDDTPEDEDSALDDPGAAASASPSPAAASRSKTPATANASAQGDEDQKQIDEMKRRDREVRTHEQAHKAAGGSYAGSVRLTYQMGPDGKRYAVEGEVPIDVSPVAGDPAATLRKMEVVARAAHAPASPSGADQAVAAQAARLMQQARAQLAAERYARTRELVPG
jgi:hypothetical protein